MSNRITDPIIQENKLYGQSYRKIKRALKKSNSIFTDEEFPPDNHSLCYTGSMEGVDPDDIKWIRAKDLFKDAQFISNGASVNDVNQGYLGDCWFLAALASLTEQPKLFKKVVTSRGQSFEDGKYFGIFHFKFYKWGTWVDVVVDDFIPTYNGRPLFTYSDDKGEAWPCLVEKAYAKLHGSYMHLSGGLCITSIENLSGGISERFIGPNGPFQALTGTSIDLFEEMSKVLKDGSIVCTGTFLHNSQIGIYGGHAYSITGLYENQERNIPRLVKVRNPWVSEMLK